MERKKKKGQDLHSFLSKIKKNGLCTLLNIYICAKELATPLSGKSQRTGFGVHTACVHHTFSLRLSFLSEIFSGKCHFRDKGKKYPEMGRDLMMSFKKNFVCFISVHLRKGINLSCLLLCAGSQDFLCP